MTETMKSREDLFNEIMKYDFAQKELNLFLDTHPDDKAALEMHASVAKKANELRREYEENYDPITSNNSLSTDKWMWIQGPWPWEN